uniref:Calsequestrin n=1 Tax=Panagrolaimus sp. JU765 TaxID=591449 RepID=A0AC34RNC9_9BILA
MFFTNIFFLFLFISDIRGQCPFKHGKVATDVPNPHAFDEDLPRFPGTEPEDTFIQTTFVHRDKDDSDLKFTQDIIELINVLRQRLKKQAKLTIDNENIDCNDGGFSQCQDYPLKDSYHFLIIEDSSHGAAVYSLEKKHNTNSEKTEQAILDALSRHSTHSLMIYASEKAEKEIGFVREVTPKELAKFAKQNQNENKKSFATSIFTRSPTELNLINEKILEFRQIESPIFDENDALKVFVADELNNLLENDERFIFVMFWTKVNTISLHAIQLWKQAAEMLKNDDNVVLGSVACHDQIDVCRAFGISHHDKNTIFVYKNAQKLTAQFSMRDADFYVEWIKIITAGIVNKIDSKDDLKQIRQGYLPFLPDLGQRKAVTIGHFQSETSEEFQRFKKVATILYGRYHFVYHIDEKYGASVTTFRPFEKMKRFDYNGNFEIATLIKHVTQGSNPSIMDFGHGFTSDLVYYSVKDLILLINDGDQEKLSQFEEMASKSENSMNYIFGKIDKKNAVSLDSFFNAMNFDTNSLPILCIFSLKNAKCLPRIGQITDKVLLEKPDDLILVELSQNKPHPLKFIQLEQINAIFGKQDVEILPEPILSKMPRNHPHG